jgi:hypothetical protein
MDAILKLIAVPSAVLCLGMQAVVSPHGIQFFRPASPEQVLCSKLYAVMGTVLTVSSRDCRLHHAGFCSNIDMVTATVRVDEIIPPDFGVVKVGDIESVMAHVDRHAAERQKNSAYRDLPPEGNVSIRSAGDFVTDREAERTLKGRRYALAFGRSYYDRELGSDAVWAAVYQGREIRWVRHEWSKPKCYTMGR